MVNKTEKVWNLQKAFSLRTMKAEIIDGVKYVYCIKHAYKFLQREQVVFAFFVACINVFHVYNYSNIFGRKVIQICKYVYSPHHIQSIPWLIKAYVHIESRSVGGFYWLLFLELLWIYWWFVPKLDLQNKDLPLMPRNFRRINTNIHN